MVVRRGPGRRYGPRRASWPGGSPGLRPPSAGLIARVPAPREPSAKWREEGGPRSLAPVPDPIGIAQTVDPSDGSADEPVVVQPITIAPLCGLASLARRPVELQLRCHDRPSQRIVPATEAAVRGGRGVRAGVNASDMDSTVGFGPSRAAPTPSSATGVGRYIWLVRMGSHDLRRRGCGCRRRPGAAVVHGGLHPARRQPGGG